MSEPAPDPPSPAPAVLAARAVTRLMRVLEPVLGELDVSLPQYRLLYFLSTGGSAASTVADAMTVSRPSVTALVDGMVSRGLVTRLADPRDGRRAEIVVTDAGARVLARADAAVAARLMELAAYLPEDDRADAITSLARWLGAEALEKEHRSAASGEGARRMSG